MSTLDSVNWLDYWQLRKKIFAFAKIIAGIIALDILISLLIGLAIDNVTALDMYLIENYDQVIDRFENHDTYLIPDKKTGWRNAPNYSKNNWQTDSVGARISGNAEPSGAADTSVFLHGSSLINGGAGIKGSETISAYLEEQGYRVRNFGTMLYSIDQIYIDYKSRLKAMQPDYLVIGLQYDDPESISNLFIPFRYKKEEYMPFLKPGIVRTDEGLKTIHPPIENQYDRESWPEMLELLDKYDNQYHKFESYKYLGILPFSNMLRRVSLKVHNKLNESTRKVTYQQLQFDLIKKINESAAANDTRVIYLMYQSRNSIASGGTPYRNLKQKISSFHQDADSPLSYIDTGDVLVDAEIPLAELYHRDGVHLSPVANRLVADAIGEHIARQSRNN